MVLLGAKEYLYFSALARPTSRYWLVLLLGTGWSFFSVLAGPPQYWLVLLGTGWSSSVLAGPARYWLVLLSTGWSCSVLAGPLQSFVRADYPAGSFPKAWSDPKQRETSRAFCVGPSQVRMPFIEMQMSPRLTSTHAVSALRGGLRED